VVALQADAEGESEQSPAGRAGHAAAGCRSCRAGAQLAAKQFDRDER
jgi:hypothetical protein